MARTISVKADDAFDSLLSELAERTQSTRSAVIREAVRRYESALEAEDLRRQIKHASLATREQALGTVRDLEAADGDSL